MQLEKMHQYLVSTKHCLNYFVPTKLGGGGGVVFSFLSLRSYDNYFENFLFHEVHFKNSHANYYDSSLDTLPALGLLIIRPSLTNSVFTVEN